MNWDLDSGFGAESAPFSRAHDEDHRGPNPSTTGCDTNLIPNYGAPDILGLGEGTNFDSPLSVNFDFPYLPESLAMGSRSAISGECMFESPYLTLRYVDRCAPGPVSRTSTLMRRQSPFIKTSEFRVGGSMLGRNFLFQNIQSCTTMLLDSKCPAPFIHASAFDRREGGTPSKSENIGICQRIAQMHATKTKDTSAFVWRTIGMEIERMNGIVSCWPTNLALWALNYNNPQTAGVSGLTLLGSMNIAMNGMYLQCSKRLQHTFFCGPLMKTPSQSTSTIS